MGDAEQIEYCADLCRLAEACPFSDLTVQRVPRKKNPQIIRVERPFFYTTLTTMLFIYIV
jgi:hypothetical protein